MDTALYRLFVTNKRMTIHMEDPDFAPDKEGDGNDAIITPETIELFTGFALTLKKIHVRLITEGYTITKDGIIPPEKRAAEPPRKRPRRGSG